MKVTVLTVGPLETNCYIVESPGSREALIVDPGAEAERVLDALAAKGLVPASIVNTHCHLDHIGADENLRARTGAPILVHSQEPISALRPNRLLEDGDLVKFGTSQLQVIHTPGHTPGSICLIGERLLFTGDTLFAGDVGRTDLPGGEEEALLNSLRKLLTLDDKIRVFPGHGPSSTMGREKRLNPYLRQAASIDS
ncbi:MAG: MBL fold metallo-hydrolase [Candidatus Bathyarchaeia archaeon]